MKFLNLLILFTLCAITTSAQVVRLHGTATQYAGLNINLETNADYITHLSRTLVTILIDDNGNFDESFNIDRITYAYFNIGAIRAGIYLSPDADYEIVMPPYIPKADADRFNPFFIPEEVELGIVSNNNNHNLNESLRNYNSAFDDAYHVEAVNIVRTHNRVAADSLITNFDSVAKSQNCQSDFFDNYVFYRDAQISALPRLRATRAITRDFFRGRNIEFANPAYWEAFDLVYRDFLPEYIRSKAGRELLGVMQQPAFTFDQMRDALMQDTLFNSTASDHELNTLFCETLLLKSIYDGSYSGKYSDTKIDSLLVGAYLSTTSQEIRNIARNILEKRNHLKPGTLAPDFTLLDTKGNEVKLSSYRGRFVYLGFFHTQNYQCLKDFPALSGVEKKYKGDVVVVGIMTDEDADKLDDFFDKRKMEWKALSFTAQQSVVIDYQISSVPAYYLIDPDGKIAIANAPGPDESVEVVIADQMQKYNHNRMNKSNDNVRTIYDIVRDIQLK